MARREWEEKLTPPQKRCLICGFFIFLILLHFVGIVGIFSILFFNSFQHWTRKTVTKQYYLLYSVIYSDIFFLLQCCQYKREVPLKNILLFAYTALKLEKSVFNFYLAHTGSQFFSNVEKFSKWSHILMTISHNVGGLSFRWISSR